MLNAMNPLWVPDITQGFSNARDAPMNWGFAKLEIRNSGFRSSPDGLMGNTAGLAQVKEAFFPVLLQQVAIEKGHFGSRCNGRLIELA